MSRIARAPLLALGLALAGGCGVEEFNHEAAFPDLGAPPPGATADAAPMETPTATPDAAVAPGVDAAAPSSDGPAPKPPVDAGPPPPPMSGAGVTIGGRFVPKEKALVVLHIGHSNMAGRATGPVDLKPFFYDVQPALWMFGHDGMFHPAMEPTAPDNEMGQAAGPGMALLHTIQAVAGPDAYAISIGHGQSGSFQGYCSNFRKGGLFYNVVMQPAMALKGRVTFAAIFTMFGQSEHNASVSDQQGFATCMAGVAADMRGDLGEPNLPFMVGDYEAGITKAGIEPTSPFGVAIIAQLHMIPGKVSRCALIPTDGVPMEDDHHFNMAGHKMWAARGVKLMIDNGWAPWATMPAALPQ